MVSASEQRPEPLDNDMLMPAWLFWLQLGLSTTLAVLFVVMLVRTRQQSVNIRQLQEKVAGIENSRALERTSAVEDQLRSTAERLQELERSSARVAGLAAENTRLRQELRSLEGAMPKPGAGADFNEPIAPLPPIKP